jgi:hypothetical protein
MDKFIKRLSIETQFSYEICEYIMQDINMEKAKQIYEESGSRKLFVYIQQVRLLEAFK